MAEIGDLVPIDDNNTGRWPEGMAPSAVNDAGRADEGIMSRWHRDTNGSLTSAGTSSAYTLTTNQTLSAYYDGLEICFVAHVACADNPTLQLGALSAAEIKTAANEAVSAGDIPSGAVVNVISQDNATTPTWRLMNSTQQKVITTQGDLIRGDSNGNPERLALGTSGQVLSSNGTDAVWADAPLPAQYIEGLELTNNATDSAHDIDIAVGSARADDGTLDIILSSAFTKRIDAIFAEGTSQGGLDTDTVAANTTYHIFVIGKTDGTGDALFSLSKASPTLPSGFTVQKRIGTIRTDSSANIVQNAFVQVTRNGEETTIAVDTTSGTTINVTSMLQDDVLSFVMSFEACGTTANGQPPIVQLGPSSGAVNTSYISNAGVISGGSAGETTNSDGFHVARALNFTTANPVRGNLFFEKIDGKNTWICSGTTVDNTLMNFTGGEIFLSGGACAIVDLTTPGGTATFNSGAVTLRAKNYV